MASTASIAAFASETVLGKRKSPKSLVLHLVADSSSQPLPLETSKKTLPILVNGLLVPHTNKRYKCTYSACEKFYSKPSRLAEHERSHTGQVVCCSSYPLFSFIYTPASFRLQYVQQIISSGKPSPSTCT